MADSSNILALYLNGPAELRRKLAGLTEAQLNLSQNPETWTIRQIAHHIADGDDMWKMLLKAALGNSDATIGLPWYWDKPQVEWAKNWNYAGRELEPSLALFEANRRHVQQLVEQIPDAWERSIWIQWREERERVTIGDIIAAQARHTSGHISEIDAIRKLFGL